MVPWVPWHHGYQGWPHVLQGVAPETFRLQVLDACATALGPGAAVALAGLLTSPLMPWPREIGDRMVREVMERGWSGAASQLDEAMALLTTALNTVGPLRLQVWPEDRPLPPPRPRGGAPADPTASTSE